MKDILEVLKEGSELGFQAAAGRAASIQNFEEKYNAFVGLITNSDGHSAHRREYLMREAETTSDFPTLFGDVLDRRRDGRELSFGFHAFDAPRLCDRHVFSVTARTRTWN